jgi:hypothetical protein
MTISPDKAHDRALKASAAFRRSFLDRAGGDRVLAERLRREYYSELGHRSGSKRRAKAALRAAELAREAEALGIMTEAELLRLAQRRS